MKSFIAVLCSAPLTYWAVALAQTPSADVAATSWLQSVSSLGFAGLVWFLLGVREPRREKELAKEREVTAAMLNEIMSDHREERDGWRDTMNMQGERSRKASEDGHKVAAEFAKGAAELAGEVKRLTDQRQNGSG